MSKCKKTLCLLFAALMALMSLSAAFCAAAEDAAAAADPAPLTVQVEMSKSAYFVSAKAKATVTVRNTGNETLNNVSVSAFSDKHLLVQGSESAQLIPELKAGESKDYSFEMVLNRKAEGVTFCERIFLFFAQLFGTYDPIEPLPIPSGCVSVSQAVTFRHGITNAELLVGAWYTYVPTYSDLWQTNVVDVLNGSAYTVSNGRYVVSYNNGTIVAKDGESVIYEDDPNNQSRLLSEIKSEILGLRSGYTLTSASGNQETYTNGSSTLVILYSSDGMDHVIKDGTYYAYSVRPDTVRPQVTYLDKYVIEILKTNVYTMEIETNQEDQTIPVTVYRDTCNEAVELSLTSILLKDLKLPAVLESLGKVRIITKGTCSENPKAYIAWTGGYCELDDAESVNEFVDSQNLDQLLQIIKNDLTYCGYTTGAGYLCETYQNTKDNTQYNFYFTTTDGYTGLVRWDIVDLSTGETEQQMVIRLYDKITDSKAFNVSGKKYSLEEVEKLFGN